MHLEYMLPIHCFGGVVILYLEDFGAPCAHKRGVCYLRVSIETPDAQAFMFRRKISLVFVMFNFDSSDFFPAKNAKYIFSETLLHPGRRRPLRQKSNKSTSLAEYCAMFSTEGLQEAALGKWAHRKGVKKVHSHPDY